LMSQLGHFLPHHVAAAAAALPHKADSLQSTGTIRENHAILSNQWFATAGVAFGDREIRRNDRWETIDFYEGLRLSARIV